MNRSRENGQIWACVWVAKSAISQPLKLKCPSELRNRPLLTPLYPGHYAQCTKRQVSARELSWYTDRVKMVRFGHVCGWQKCHLPTPEAQVTVRVEEQAPTHSIVPWPLRTVH